MADVQSEAVEPATDIPVTLDPAPSIAASPDVPSKRGLTRLSSLHTGLIVAAVVLVLLLVFILENDHSVNVRFIGLSSHLPLSVALLLSAVAGALLVGTIGAARITQLRRAVARQARRADRHR